MPLEKVFTPNRALVVQGSLSRDELLEQVAEVAAASLNGVSSAELLAALKSREEQMPTSTPEGVAFPHALLPAVEGSAVVIALAREGVRFSKRDHPPVTLAMAMFGNSAEPWEHVRLLARLARIARGEGALERIAEATDAQDLYEKIMAEDRAHG